MTPDEITDKVKPMYDSLVGLDLETAINVVGTLMLSVATMSSDPLATIGQMAGRAAAPIIKGRKL